MDRNCTKKTPPHITQRSLSARRAWIEIRDADGAYLVDSVALRKESVDRNLYYGDDLTFSDVALRKESVDRNINADVSYNIKETSLSARRAWIEIICSPIPALLL